MTSVKNLLRNVKSLIRSQQRQQVVASAGPAPPVAAMPEHPLQKLVDKVRSAVGQLSNIEYGVLIGAVAQASPCRLLVFGMGNDSDLWAYLNHGGRTAYLEDVPEWLRDIPGAESYLVRYPGLRLPNDIASTEWDLVFVDGPIGWDPERPGREEAIKAASAVVRADGWVFVHDYERERERLACDRYLGRPTHVIDKMAMFCCRSTPT